MSVMLAAVAGLTSGIAATICTTRLIRHGAPRRRRTDGAEAPLPHWSPMAASARLRAKPETIQHYETMADQAAELRHLHDLSTVAVLPIRRRPSDQRRRRVG